MQEAVLHYEYSHAIRCKSMIIYTICNKIRPLISVINTPDISEELISGGIHDGQLSMGLSGTGTSSVKYTNH